VTDAAEAGRRFSPYVRRVLIALGLATAIVVLLYLVWQVGQAVLVLFASCLFGIFLSGLSGFLSRKTGLPYGGSLLLVVLALVTLLGGTTTLLAAQLGQQADDLREGLTGIVEDGLDRIQQTTWGRQLLQQAQDDEGLQLRELGPPAARWLSTAMGAMTVALVIVVIGLYLAADPGLYKYGVLKLVPIAKRPRARDVLDAIGNALAGWLLAQFVSMVVIGTLVAVGLWAFGIELWLILGLLAGVLTFIPNLGPIIAGIPPVLLAMNQGLWVALGVMAYFVAVQCLEGYFVTPMVQHRVIRLPPAAILAVQVLAAYTFGLLGVAVAAPLLAATMVAVEMLYVQDLLGDKNVAVTGQQHDLLGS
jgi:predicted PurR-regulated permease PerM